MQWVFRSVHRSTHTHTDCTNSRLLTYKKMLLNSIFFFIFSFFVIRRVQWNDMCGGGGDTVAYKGECERAKDSKWYLYVCVCIWCSYVYVPYAQRDRFIIWVGGWLSACVCVCFFFITWHLSCWISSDSIVKMCDGKFSGNIFSMRARVTIRNRGVYACATVSKENEFWHVRRRDDCGNDKVPCI